MYDDLQKLPYLTPHENSLWKSNFQVNKITLSEKGVNPQFGLFHLNEICYHIQFSFNTFGLKE